MNRSLLTLVILFAVSTSCSLAADGWSQFRGANVNGVSETKSPTEWSSDRNIAWKVKIPGVGWSQPIAWGDRIFVTTAESDKGGKPERGISGPGFDPKTRLKELIFGGNLGLEPPDEIYRWKLLCLDANTGNVIWEKTAHEGKPTIHIHPSNTYASETPTTDGERVIAYFGMTGIYCYDFSGTLLWSKDLETYPMQFGWGTGSSPVLYEDRVFVQCDNDKSSFLMALEKVTGQEAWRVARDENSNWSTPFVWKNKQRTELVTAGGAKMRSYDPSTGTLLWEMKGSGRTATTPVGNDELLYVDSVDRLTGHTGTFAAVRAGATGDISLKTGESTNSHVAWSIRLKCNRVASPVVVEECVFLVEQPSGIIHCHDAITGKEHYRKRLPGAKGFTASPWAGAGNVFCLDQDGLTLVIDPGPELKVVSSNDLGDEMFWSSAAIVGDRLLLRSADHLYCIEEK